MKIAVTSPSFSRNETLTQELYSLFPESKINKNGLNLDGKELIEFIKDAEGIIVGLERIRPITIRNLVYAIRFFISSTAAERMRQDGPFRVKLT